MESREETKTVPERLKGLADLFAERNKQYKDNYKRFGGILKSMFPKGVCLQTTENLNRFALFNMLMHKLSRYAADFENENRSTDTLNDLSVYAQLLAEYDDEMRSLRHRNDRPSEQSSSAVRESTEGH